MLKPAASRLKKMSRLHEAIPSTRLREDVARPRRVRFDLAPQLGDVDVQVVRLGAVRLSPYLVQDRTVRQELSLVSGKQCEQRVFLRRQLNTLAAHRHCMRLEVDAELADLEDRLTRALRPAECRAQPRQQLVETERLRHVIVGASVERRDL